MCHTYIASTIQYVHHTFFTGTSSTGSSVVPVSLSLLLLLFLPFLPPTPPLPPDTAPLLLWPVASSTTWSASIALLSVVRETSQECDLGWWILNLLTSRHTHRRRKHRNKLWLAMVGERGSGAAVWDRDRECVLACRPWRQGGRPHRVLSGALGSTCSLERR